MKILFVDYEQGYAIIELLGEWNDAIENDIMTLRRDVTDILFADGISKFIFIAENGTQFSQQRRQLLRRMAGTT